MECPTDLSRHQPFWTALLGGPPRMGISQSTLRAIIDHEQSNRVPHGNWYGRTEISGSANVFMGNVPNTFHLIVPDTQSSAKASVGSHGNWETCNTRRCFHLPWLLTLIEAKTQQRSSRIAQCSYYYRLSLFGIYMLRFAFQTEASRSLRLFCPTIHNIIPDDHGVVVACQTGDLLSLRALLSKHEARIHDVTINNYSLLYHAIDNGHAHTVDELLSMGADSNQTFGDFETSPLAWAIFKRDEQMIRSLISHGADVLAVSAAGWSILFYLWINEVTLQPSCLELLTMLRTAEPEVLALSRHHFVGYDGFSLLSRVACAGTPDEVQYLIERGADVYWKNEYGWSAPFEAVFGDKLENLRVLQPYFPELLCLRDARGWTLLHVAAEFGHAEVIRYLLQQGADSEAKSWATKSHVPQDLIGVTCTPAETARSQSIEREQLYLSLVEQVKRDAQHSNTGWQHN